MLVGKQSLVPRASFGASATPSMQVHNIRMATSRESRMRHIVHCAAYTNHHHVVSGTPVDSDRTFMKVAIREAEIAYKQYEVPVGAVIVKGGREISRAHNKVEQSKDATAHAEMLCIQQASQKVGGARKQTPES